MSELYNIFFRINSSMSMRETLVIAFASLLMGIFVDITYHITHAHVQTDPFFHASLLVASLICAIVIYSASGVGVLCLTAVTATYGLFVGKMNRSRIKDARIFLVWAIACGVLCAEQRFLVSALMCVIIFFIFLIFRLVDNMPYLLTISGSDPHQMETQAAVFDLFGKRARLISSGSDGVSFEITYKVSSGVLREFERQRIDFLGAIQKVPGILSVSVGKEEQHDEW